MKPTEFREITQITTFGVIDFGTSRKPIYDFLLVINVTDLQSCTVSKLQLNICKILARDSRALHFNAPAGVIPCEFSDKLYLSRN